MTSEQYTDLVTLLTERFDQLVFLLQVLCQASCFLCAFVCMQLIIHAKNQKNLF